jgi:hypothetical protein
MVLSGRVICERNCPRDITLGQASGSATVLAASASERRRYGRLIMPEGRHRGAVELAVVDSATPSAPTRNRVIPPGAVTRRTKR